MIKLQREVREKSSKLESLQTKYEGMDRVSMLIFDPKITMLLSVVDVPLRDSCGGSWPDLIDYLKLWSFCFYFGYFGHFQKL